MCVSQSDSIRNVTCFSFSIYQLSSFCIRIFSIIRLDLCWLRLAGKSFKYDIANTVATPRLQRLQHYRADEMLLTQRNKHIQTPAIILTTTYDLLTCPHSTHTHTPSHTRTRCKQYQHSHKNIAKCYSSRKRTDQL